MTKAPPLSADELFLHGKVLSRSAREIVVWFRRCYRGIESTFKSMSGLGTCVVVGFSGDCGGQLSDVAHLSVVKSQLLQVIGYSSVKLYC